MPYDPIGQIGTPVLSGSSGLWVRQSDGGYLFQHRGRLTQDAEIKSANFSETDKEGWRLEGNGGVDLYSSDYSLLDEDVAAGGESTLLLDVLPQTHRNLVLVFTGGHDGVAGLASHVLRFNSDGTASYYYARQEIDAAGTHTTNGNTGASGINTGGLSSGRGQIVLWVADYSMQQDAGSYLAVSWQAATRFGTATTANVFTSGGGFYNAGTGVPLESARLVLTSGDGFQADSRLAAYGVGAL